MTQESRVLSQDPKLLLDCSNPFDATKVQLLDEVVQVLLVGNPREREVSHEVLTQLKLEPDSWRVVGTVLQISTNSNTKFFALGILQTAVQSRWKVLPEEQKQGIKQFVTDLALKCATEPSMTNEKHFLTKVDETLIQIVKNEWPDRWESFIPDICSAAKTNQAICENNMHILNLLSEEVFDFGRDQMTSRKCQRLRETMASQFQQIFDLCMFIVENHLTTPGSVATSLLSTTLKCLSHFLRWIPYGYIFQTPLVDLLLDHFWDSPQFRIHCVSCLGEVAVLEGVGDEGLKILSRLWVKFVQKLSQLPEITLEYETKVAANARVFWETFYAQLALCLTSFLKHHRSDVCEVPNAAGEDPFQILLFALDFVVKLTKVPHDETFKICLDFWHHLTQSLTLEVTQTAKATRPTTALLLLGHDEDQTSVEPFDSPADYSKRLELLQPLLNKVRITMISRMAKPQEVYINYDEETGTVDRDYQPDTDEIALYNTMREALVYLTNLGGTETQSIMESGLADLSSKVSDPSHEWNPMGLSRLCWAMGSISGAMSATRERAFVVGILKTLLVLCENKSGKENKALIASMIMYVVGQYPRFLMAYARFLEVVVQKLFEFMRETFPGVQDMATETFLKVAKKCSRTMATPQATDRIGGPMKEAMIGAILVQVPALQASLTTSRQVLLLYEAVAHIIAMAPAASRPELIKVLLSQCDSQWQQQVMPPGYTEETLVSTVTSKAVTEIVRINGRVAYGTGASFSLQFNNSYEMFLRIYKLYSARLSAEVSFHGPSIMGHAHVKQLRSAKREILNLISIFVDKAGAESPESRQEIVSRCVPPLRELVLSDYLQGVPQARDHEVLSLWTSLLTRLQGAIQMELPTLFDFVFDCTLDMIKGDFHSFPDHREQFYTMMSACNKHCFEGLLALPEARLQRYVESLVWATQHQQPAVAEQGLRILSHLLKQLIDTQRQGNSTLLLGFCKTFYYYLFHEILGVMTDTLHKSGFTLQCRTLQQLVLIVDTGMVQDVESNLTKQQVMEVLVQSLLQFQQLSRSQVEAFALDIFNKCEDPQEFTSHLRDFLIQMKEFAGADDLFDQERQEALERAQQKQMSQVPGLQTEQLIAKLQFPLEED